MATVLYAGCYSSSLVYFGFLLTSGIRFVLKYYFITVIVRVESGLDGLGIKVISHSNMKSVISY